MAMNDEAPKSSRHVRHALYRTEIDPNVIDHLDIVTIVDHKGRAVTILQRPQSRNPIMIAGVTEQERWDAEVRRVLNELPGSTGCSLAGVSQTYEATWTGVCRPI